MKNWIKNLSNDLADNADLKVDVQIAPDGKSITYIVELEKPYDISVGAIINSLSAIAKGDSNFRKGKDGPVIIPKIPSLRRQLSAQFAKADVTPLQSATKAIANT